MYLLFKHFFFITLRELSWLAGEMTKCRVGAQRGGGEKRLRVQMWGLQLIGRPQRWPEMSLLYSGNRNI